MQDLRTRALLCRFLCRKGVREVCYKKGRRLLPEFHLTENFARARIANLQDVVHQPEASCRRWPPILVQQCMQSPKRLWHAWTQHAALTSMWGIQHKLSVSLCHVQVAPVMQRLANIAAEVFESRSPASKGSLQPQAEGPDASNPKEAPMQDDASAAADGRKRQPALLKPQHAVFVAQIGS